MKYRVLVFKHVVHTRTIRLKEVDLMVMRVHNETCRNNPTVVHKDQI